MGAAAGAVSPAGAAAAQEAPDAFWHSTSLGSSPRVLGDAARWGLGGGCWSTWAVCLRALWPEELGSATPRDAPTENKWGACSPGETWSWALVGGWGVPHVRTHSGSACLSQLGRCYQQSGHVWVI